MAILKIRGGEVIIDNEDLETVKNLNGLHINHGGYVCGYVRIDGKMKWRRVHRLIAKPQEDEDVDHINGVRHDNRRKNLRICSRSQNLQSQRAGLRGSSGYKGVSYHNGKSKRVKRWEAYINFQGKKIKLGYFHTAEEAAKAYDAAALKYFGEFAQINGVR